MAEDKELAKKLAKVDMTKLKKFVEAMGAELDKSLAKADAMNFFLDTVDAQGEGLKKVKGAADIQKYYDYLVELFELGGEGEGDGKVDPADDTDVKSKKGKATPAPVKKTAAAPVPAGKKTAAAPATKKEAPKSPKGNGYTRIYSIVDAVKAKKKGTLDDYVTSGDALYEKKGGTSNTKESLWAARIVVQTLEHYGILEKDGDNYVRQE